jgi:hypothetical protein
MTKSIFGFVPKEDIPELYALYVAAERADYYARVDAARPANNHEPQACYVQIFMEELEYSKHHPELLDEWQGNNMNPFLNVFTGNATVVLGTANRPSGDTPSAEELENKLVRLKLAVANAITEISGSDFFEDFKDVVEDLREAMT